MIESYYEIYINMGISITFLCLSKSLNSQGEWGGGVVVTMQLPLKNIAVKITKEIVV